MVVTLDGGEQKAVRTVSDESRMDYVPTAYGSISMGICLKAASCRGGPLAPKGKPLFQKEPKKSPFGGFKIPGLRTSSTSEGLQTRCRLSANASTCAKQSNLPAPPSPPAAEYYASCPMDMEKEKRGEKPGTRLTLKMIDNILDRDSRNKSTVPKVKLTDLRGKTSKQVHNTYRVFF